MGGRADPLRAQGVEIASGQSQIPVPGGGDTTFVAVSMPGDPDAAPEYIYITQGDLSVHYYDSQETVGEDGQAVNTIDGDPATIWHTRWYGGTDPMPHEIQRNLGDTYDVAAFQYLPRQNSANGRISEYEIYVNVDGSNWGTPAATGIWSNTTNEQTVSFDPEEGRFVRLVALSEVNGNPWTSAGELNVLRCSGIASVEGGPSGIHAGFRVEVLPNPFSQKATVRFSIPSAGRVRVGIYDVCGRSVASLADRPMEAGIHEVYWSGADAASGIYYCRVATGGCERVVRLVLLQ